MLDLNVLQSIMEHWISLKASYSSIITIYHGRIQHLCFLLAHDNVARLKLKHIQVALLCHQESLPWISNPSSQTSE
jgi:hypothetical protein